MDPRSATATRLSQAVDVIGSSLEHLAEASRRDFSNLLEARKRTADGLTAKRQKLSALQHDSDVSVVLMGSWGREEVTSGSDDDFMVLVNGEVRWTRLRIKPATRTVRKILTNPPRKGGPFGKPVYSQTLVDDIGLDRDTNNNLTQRMLFLLESVPVTADHVYSEAKKKILSEYLDESIKDRHPPRFLLNDTVRYWRTICVDFAGKERAGPEKWGLRNAKLRTSRKLLFAGGLLPILKCSQIESDQMFDFLLKEFAMPPTDRIARTFLEYDRADAGGRALGAYDKFLGLLNDEGFRQQLQDTDRPSADDSDAFKEVRELGRILQNGLLALLFETESLPKVVRDYAIF